MPAVSYVLGREACPPPRVNLSQLSSDDIWRLNLFQDYAKKMNLGYVMDGIKNRFGDTAIIRAASLTAAGQAFERAAKIGGHYK